MRSRSLPALLVLVSIVAMLLPSVLAAEALTDAQVRAYLDRLRPGELRELLDEPQTARTFLRNISAFMAIERLTAEQGLLDDPEVQSRLAVARRETLTAVLRDRFLRAHAPDPAAVTALAEDQYSAFTDRFQAPRRLRIAHISVNYDPCHPEEAEALLRAARDRVEAGEGFLDVAREVSQAPNASSGGLIGRWLVDSPDMRRAPMFQQAIELTRPGEMSAPFADSGGYHLIMLVADRPGQTLPFPAVQRQLEGRIQTRYVTEQTARFTASLYPGSDAELDLEQLDRLAQARLDQAIAAGKDETD